MKHQNLKNEPVICPYCKQPTVIIEVHGHGQCMLCKNNIDPCCSGSSPDDLTVQEEKENRKTQSD